jgi:hypothetical protein
MTCNNYIIGATRGPGISAHPLELVIFASLTATYAVHVAPFSIGCLFMLTASKSREGAASIFVHRE